MSNTKPVQAQSFAFNVDGVTHTLAMPLSITHSMRMRAEIGISQPELMAYMAKPDLDCMAVCVWLARLQAGESVTFAAVADSITYESELSIGVVEDEHPEL